MFKGAPKKFDYVLFEIHCQMSKFRQIKNQQKRQNSKKWHSFLKLQSGKIIFQYLSEVFFFHFIQTFGW